MILTPFKIVYELFIFGLQALFLYGLALILCVGAIAYVIADNKQSQVQYIYEKVIIEKEYKKKIEEYKTEKECTKLAGCRILKDGTIEY